MDRKAFHKLTNGLYIVGAQTGGKRAGCVVNTVLQVTSKPAQLLVAVNKENFTCGVIHEAGAFSAAVLSQDIDVRTIGTFGFATSTTTDKFAAVAAKETTAGAPYPTEGVVAFFGCKVAQEVDCGSHIAFIGEVEDAEVLSEGTPLTYDYYHSVLKLKTPPKASSFDPDAQ